MLFSEPGHRYNAFDQFSMVLALVLGTAGLPHILNRYYTNPSGKAARRSTFWVLIFIGTFYIFAPIAGLAGRRVFIKAAWPTARAPASAAYVDGYPRQVRPAHADARRRSSAASGSWVSWPQARSRPCSPPSAVC